MITLKIKKNTSSADTPTTITKAPKLSIADAIDGIVSIPDRSIELTATRQLSEHDWYDSFISSKYTSMLNGGTLIDDQLSTTKEPTEYIFEFETGYRGYLEHTVRKIHGISPKSNGDLSLLGSKFLEVSTQLDAKGTIKVEDEDGTVRQIAATNVVIVTLPVHHPLVNTMYQDIYYLTWRMYHCLNSISGRMQLYDPTVPRDGNPAITTMGYYLGTYLQYQALVARWNHFAWTSAFTLEVIEAGERATVIVGYTNLNCNTIGFSYELDILLTRGIILIQGYKHLKNLQITHSTTSQIMSGRTQEILIKTR